METNSLWQRIKARKLQSNVYTLVAFMVLFIISTALYIFLPAGIPGEIFIAISTSLLATVFISFFDIYTAYKNFENSTFIDNLYAFGIHNLYFDKQEVLTRLIREAHTEIWISGYRLILTKNLAAELHAARQRGVNLRFLVCPPWTDTFKRIYNDSEASLENYLSIMNALDQGSDKPGVGSIQVHITNKPLFNDTYLIDDKIVTSPYLHNRDLTFGVISAGDFFTYELDKNYKLFQLMKDEYQIVWDSSQWILTQQSAAKIVRSIEKSSNDQRYLDFWEKAQIFVDNMDVNTEATGLNQYEKGLPLHVTDTHSEVKDSEANSIE